MKTHPSNKQNTQFSTNTSNASLPAYNRRTFVRRALAAGAAANLAGLALSSADGSPPLGGGQPGNPNQRRTQAYKAEMQQSLPPHPDNGDEARFPNKLGSFSKGLPHNDLGEVDLAAYGLLLHALASGDPADFERIPMGCPDPVNRFKLVDPQSGLAFDLEGVDSHCTYQPPAPAFGSAQESGEIIELYWMALTRDVPYAEYDTNPLTQAAAADLSSLADFRGPKANGHVTTGTLFRDPLPGCLVGPYVSQFRWLPAPYGASYVDQQMRTGTAGVDYMTDYTEWLNIQRGYPPTQPQQFDSTRRFIRNGRDAGQWVHMDVLHQAYFQAMLTLLAPPSSDPHMSGMAAPFNVGNPYNHSLTQTGFGTFGGPHTATLLPEVSTRALHAVWFQKWFVHRRLRPEVYAGRIHNFLTGAAPQYPVGTSDLLNSSVLSRLFSQSGTYLLPMAFPEGSPLHPSYGAGHATVAGACVTILKAFFDESYVIPNPVEATSDGQSLVPYTGPALTVGGELNKLASNVATGRNIAGVHWRTDALESLKLGEAVAISLLQDQKNTYNENLSGFTLTKFDGTQVTI
jgi:hypothetical protein